MVQLCNAFGPGMKARNWGRIVNMSSGIADQPNLAPSSTEYQSKYLNWSGSSKTPFTVLGIFRFAHVITGSNSESRLFTSPYICLISAHDT
jgi:hypothetical protein